MWKAPDFDPRQPAVYYARIIEIPTPRWTAYEAVRYGITMPEEVPMKTQERALHVAHLVHTVRVAG